MPKRALQIIILAVALTAFFGIEYMNASKEASYFSLPLAIAILNSGLRYFIISIGLGIVLNLTMVHNGKNSPIRILPFALAAVICASIVYSVTRLQTVLIVTPSLFAIPGALIGWDIVTLYFYKTNSLRNVASSNMQS